MKRKWINVWSVPKPFLFTWNLQKKKKIPALCIESTTIRLLKIILISTSYTTSILFSFISSNHHFQGLQSKRCTKIPECNDDGKKFKKNKNTVFIMPWRTIIDEVWLWNCPFLKIDHFFEYQLLQSIGREVIYLNLNRGKFSILPQSWKVISQ